MTDETVEQATETLTYFQGQLLIDIRDHGPSKCAQICSRMAGKLDKAVKYQNSTIAQNLQDLETKGFVRTDERVEGDLEIRVHYYSLTESGLAYISLVK